MRAASSSSIGMLRKNGRRMTIESGNPKAACGSATPSRLPDSPSWRMRTYSGRIATAVGKSSPNTNRVYIASRPRNRIRANTNAAADAQPTVTPTATIATIDAVEELAPEGGGVLAPQDVGVVVEDPRVRDERHRVRGQLTVVLEATEDGVDDRQQDRGRHREQDDEGHGPGDRAARTPRPCHGLDRGRLGAHVGGCPSRHRLTRCRRSRRRRCRDAARTAGTAGRRRAHTGTAARRTHCRTPSAASRSRS